MPGVNSFRAGRLEELAAHPTVKPVALVADAIKDCSKRNGLVLDPFAGSGTVLIAAERTGRIARALEPIREVWIHDEAFAASRLSMMRIIARRTKAATVIA